MEKTSRWKIKISVAETHAMLTGRERDEIDFRITMEGEEEIPSAQGLTPNMEAPQI